MAPLSDEEKERVRRFVAKHSLPEREAVEADVAEYRGKSLEERGRDIESVCRDAAAILSSRPDRDRILMEDDPPHPSYFAIMERLRRQYRERRRAEGTSGGALA